MIRITAATGHVTLNLSAGAHRLAADRRLFEEIGTGLLSLVNKGFEDEAEPEGSAWAPLARATRQRRGGDANPILRRSGDLKRSITYRVEPGGVFVGTNRPYARIHQFGGEIKRAAGVVKLHFRVVGRGRGKGRKLFARSGDRRTKYGMKAAVGAHVIRIPARPYLFGRDGGIPETWKAAILGIVKKHLEPDHA